jgi:flagellar hook assembly protein FlgD
VTIDILDARGRRQAVVADEELGAGGHHREWDGADQAGRRLPSGSYLCRLSASGSVWTTKLLLLR